LLIALSSSSLVAGLYDCTGVTDADGRSQLHELNFSWQDYLVFAISLAIPLGIGIFFFFYKRKLQSTESFLVGDRSLNVFAVAMSLLASILNGIFVIGLPAEVHYHGVEMTYMVIAAVVITALSAHVFIPQFRRMKFTSAYEVYAVLQGMYDGGLCGFYQKTFFLHANAKTVSTESFKSYMYSWNCCVYASTHGN